MWALPTPDGQIDGENFSFKQVAEISEDGSFSLNLKKEITYQGETYDLDWVLLLINSQAPFKEDRIIGYIVMSDVSDSMLRMPVSNASGNIDLGTLSQSGDEAYSSTSLEESEEDFALSLEQLREIARTDDVLKNIKNAYINYDEETGIYFELEPNFTWYDSPTRIDNRFADPAAYSFAGYLLYMSTNNLSDLAFEDLCAPDADSNPAVSLGLYPPEAIMDGYGNSYDQTTPIDNADATVPSLRGDGKYECSATNFYARDDSDEERLQMNFIGGDTNLVPPPIAEGYWVLMADDSQLAVFDVAAANPFDTNGDPVVYVPSLAVTTDESNVITAIDVRWYRFDPDASEYVEVVDTTILNDSVDGGGITLDDYSGTDGNGGQRIEEHNSSDESDGVITSWTSFEQTWRFTGDSSTDTAVAESIAINYSMGGVSFRFVWRPMET